MRRSCTLITTFFFLSSLAQAEIKISLPQAPPPSENARLLDKLPRLPIRPWESRATLLERRVNALRDQLLSVRVGSGSIRLFDDKLVSYHQTQGGK